MTIQLDHLFICSQVNAPEIDRILDLGLVEGKSNIHLGQGTANRRIFFDNFMLELLFAIDEGELSSSTIKRTHFQERLSYQRTSYSPFGVAFRYTENTHSSLPTWAYKPPYLPDNLQIDIISNTASNEPFLFVVPFAKSQNRLINHPEGIRKITRVEITIPDNRGNQAFSEAIISVQNLQDNVKFLSGTDNLAVLEFDSFIQQQEKDFRPYLPLIFRY